MSFVKVGRPQQYNKGKRAVRPKKAAAATKREWVSTVNDLSVHKLTPAEMNHRHEIHKSHNKAAAQWELKEKALKRRFRHAGSPAPLDRTSLSIIREVFSDQLLLQDVVARSDRAMAVVKDLFGDAPRRQTGHPSVTMAPNCNSELPVLQRPDPPTHLSLLSQSVMDQEALNELEASEDDHIDDNAHPSGSSAYSIIQRSNVQKMKAQSLGRVNQQHKVHHPNPQQGDNFPVTPCLSGRAPDQTALNATVAVQRVRSKQNQLAEGKKEPSALLSQVLNPDLRPSPSGRVSSRKSRSRRCVSQSSELDGSSVASLSADHSSLGLLQAMLCQVEADLDSLSPDTTLTPAKSQKQQGLTGFSVALVSTLGRLVHLLKQREDEAEKETETRKRLEEEVKEQRGLIDALTAETMTLREEAAALQAVLQQRTAELEQKLDTVVLAMGGLGIMGDYINQGNSSAGCYIRRSTEQLPEQTHVSVSPAVLLSPPRQADNWQQIPPVTHSVQLHQPFRPTDVLRFNQDVQCHGSASSLSSLPLTSVPSTSLQSVTSDPLCSQLSPDVMLAEIAQLSRQNELIRAQLNQAKVQAGSSIGASLSSGSERRSSSGSTQRRTPQNIEARTTSGSNSTGSVTPQSVIDSSTSRQNQNPPEEEQRNQQASSSNSLSVSSVEQRLLELNRQSAAARGRLLELIEQQKQNVSAKVSPSVSPVPPSAFSPHAAVGGGSLEASLLPEQDVWSHSGEGRSAGSDVSSHSFGGETRYRKTQVEKQREHESWFALSTHVR
ncbi:spindle and centriole-associated protein 1 isoform X2 [Parambassis ranga]|uniref:Spindle and centriole-associated protein 1 n=1 Tax=Parambassis ranga TaxID=210632 RepID=A0A6P7KH93_9TELE|nr:spindle and centriole-associated protein 1 isoform X2 [Parambassis ranga]